MFSLSFALFRCLMSCFCLAQKLQVVHYDYIKQHIAATLHIEDLCAHNKMPAPAAVMPTRVRKGCGNAEIAFATMRLRIEVLLKYGAKH